MSPSMIIGEAVGIQHRSEFVGRLQVCAFRVERLDTSSNRLPPVPVEMRGWLFVGVLNEADRIEIKGSWQAGRTLRVGRLRNLTTGGQVVARPLYEPLLLIAAALVLWLGLMANFEAQARGNLGHFQATSVANAASFDATATAQKFDFDQHVSAMQTAAAKDQESIQRQIDAAFGSGASSREQFQLPCGIGFNPPCPPPTPTPTRQVP